MKRPEAKRLIGRCLWSLYYLFAGLIGIIIVILSVAITGIVYMLVWPWMKGNLRQH
ncbi:hypothetical protein [Mucilaginibacter gracilis]|uniref:hypothetical protein n=1 Tax=Mucilaginibacter gracilis TaxID=423350 RepID=UPI0013C34A75|nr:hypothetical protein [Mucilaginibacter gracilis]